MHIQDKQHPLYLGLDRIQALSKQDPMRLGQLFTERAILAQQTREEAFKKAGIAFSYRDADYPGCLIEEQPDGRRFIIELDPAAQYAKRIIREIPPRAA